jgi:hypothetical protein
VAHIQILEDQKVITLAEVIFNLDGGSEQKNHEHDLSYGAAFAYDRTESHKIACWHKNQNSYIFLRSKKIADSTEKLKFLYKEQKNRHDLRGLYSL